MKRLVALSVIVMVGNASAAFAGEPLLASATWLTREITSSQAAASSKADRTAGKELGVTSFAKAARVGEPVVLGQQGGAISTSGLSKRSKTLIIAGAAAAFVGIAYGIDHHVRDVTPSSLGTRQDK